MVDAVPQPTALTRDDVLRAPKVLLHDHLDGGLRPATVLELAREVGHELPTDPDGDAAALGRWFAEAADSGSLERYLETFTHTVAVMQTADALTRVARECVEDLVTDGVVYAEVRYAPEQHLEQGLSLDEVVEAVQRGFDEGVTRHLDAFEYLQRENFHFTIHAGEAFGTPSIWEALQWCGADRLGHGVRIVDDITVAEDGSVELGRLAAYVRDKRIPLELCPASNVQTGAASSVAEHPIGLLTDLRFRVTVNTDNRLMSGTSMTDEMWSLVQAFGHDASTLRWFTINAMKSAFLPFDERLALIDEVIKPGYAALTDAATS